MTGPQGDAERFLLDFHARHPGTTARALARGRTADGGSSYELLAGLVRPGQRVLDLGCGDGFLLELLAARGHAAVDLAGVDLSPHELAAARRRPALAGVSLACEPARSLSAADGAFDVVLSHLAFMLMSDLEPTIAELARVLRPGGSFATIVGGGPGPGDAFELFLGLLASVSRDLPLRAPRLGDVRARDAAGLDPLMCAGGLFAPIDDSAHAVRLDGDAAELRDTFAGLYEVSVLPPARAEELGARFAAESARLAGPDGAIPCTMRVRRLRYRRTQLEAKAPSGAGPDLNI